MIWNWIITAEVYYVPTMVNYTKPKRNNNSVTSYKHNSTSLSYYIAVAMVKSDFYMKCESCCTTILIVRLHNLRARVLY